MNGNSVAPRHLWFDVRCPVKDDITFLTKYGSNVVHPTYGKPIPSVGWNAAVEMSDYAEPLPFIAAQGGRGWCHYTHRKWVRLNRSYWHVRLRRKLTLCAGISMVQIHASCKISVALYGCMQCGSLFRCRPINGPFHRNQNIAARIWWCDTTGKARPPYTAMCQSSAYLGQARNTHGYRQDELSPAP